MTRAQIGADMDIKEALEAAPYELRTPNGQAAPMPSLEAAVYVAQRLFELGMREAWVEIRDRRRDVRVGRLYK